MDFIDLNSAFSGMASPHDDLTCGCPSGVKAVIVAKSTSSPFSSQTFAYKFDGGTTDVEVVRGGGRVIKVGVDPAEVPRVFDRLAEHVGHAVGLADPLKAGQRVCKF